MARLIVVDDEPGVRAMLRAHLEPLGHQIREASDGAALRRLLGEEEAQLVLLDLNLPGENGLDLARTLRARYPCGIIMLTADARIENQILGLDGGADDYVTKPCELAELAARVNAVLRRRSGPGDGRITFGEYVVDLRQFRLLTARGTVVELLPAEMDLVAAFAIHQGRVLSRDELLRLAPARSGDPFDRSIDSRVTRLRRKLERDPRRPSLIRTVRAVGYIHLPDAPREPVAE